MMPGAHDARALASPGDPRLRLVCPACHVDVVPTPDDGCRCTGCGARYPKRAAVRVFLTDEEWDACQARAREEADVLRQYQFARRHVPLTVQYYDWWIARLLAQIPTAYCGPLVELMCGGAEVSRRLPARFSSALALDVDVNMVEDAARDLCRAGESRVQVVCGTAARVPLPDQCTGAVIVQGALHHARPLLAQILSEVSRILVPNGVFVGSEPANDHPLTRGVRHWQYRRSHLQGKDPDEDGFTREELAAALAKAGLFLDDYQQFGFIAYPLMGNTDEVRVLTRVRSRRLGRILLRVDEALERVPIVRDLAWASLFRAVKAA